MLRMRTSAYGCPKNDTLQQIDERWPSRLVATAAEGWDPQHWRFRAEEARTVADQMTHEDARTIMRRIAMDYDRLAKLAEEQLADKERGTIDD
jgi:hypothetical protein